MLTSLRKSAGGIVAKIFLSLLVLSFAVWGIADIFTGYGSGDVAKVGSINVSQAAFQRAFQIENQRFSRQVQRPLSLNEARQFGLDQVVLNQMISGAVLDEDAARKKIGVSQEKIAEDIVTDPQFRSAANTFSRLALDGYLRASGQSEAGYVAERQRLARREQLAEAVTGGLAPGRTLQEVAHTYRNEARTARFVTLNAADIDSIADPDDTVLIAYFEANKARFKAPEYRRLSYVVLDPQAIADTIDISDTDLADAYEVRIKDFETPEQRTVRQIPFATEEDAAAAKARLDGGLAFDDLVAEMNLSQDDVALGTVARSDIFDPAIAEAAFALAEDTVSDPVKGQFRTVLLTVSGITPAATQPFDAVQDGLRADLALEQANEQLFDLFDAVEDDRAAGLTLKEIGDKPGLTYGEVAAIDRTGRDMAGAVVTGLPASSQLITGAFAADVGVETDPLQIGASGSLWYGVDEITPSRDRTLDEAREAAVTAWRAEQVEAALQERADALLDRLRSGETLDAIASKDALIITRTAPLKRSDAAGDLSQEARDRLFKTEVGAAFDIGHNNGTDRLVVTLVKKATPPFDPKDEAAKALAGQLAQTMTDDLLAQYVTEKRNAFGATVNQQALSLALGLAPDGH